MRAVWRGAAAALVALAAGLVLAQEGRADITISVAPSLVEVSATPGGTGDLALTVYNEGSEAFAVQAGVMSLREGTGHLSAVDWLQVEPANFDLAPGQQRQVKVTIRAPHNLDSGGRYAMVTFTTGAKTVEAAKAPAKGQAAVSGQIGVPILITVQGPNHCGSRRASCA